jgi:hypothetical protein
MIRIGLIVLAALLLAPNSSGAVGEYHLVQRSTWAGEPTVPESMALRVEAAANQYQQYGSVPRVALFDIAYPLSDAELKSMGGYGVLLLTVLSHDATELPPKRLYGVISGVEIPLPLITATTSPTRQTARVSKVLGAHRWDALYLFPIYLLQDSAQIKVDFAANRAGFVLGAFSSAEQSNLGYSNFIFKPPQDVSPPSPVVTGLVAREFPGFLNSTKDSGLSK